MMAVLFFAVPPTMNPINRRMLPQMMNQRRPNKSELAPQILENISEYQDFPQSEQTYMNANVTVIVYIGTYHAA